MNSQLYLKFQCDKCLTSFIYCLHILKKMIKNKKFKKLITHNKVNFKLNCSNYILHQKPYCCHVIYHK